MMVNRLRHTLGFGVHSPRLYALVKDVVQTPRGCQYYNQNEAELILRSLPGGLRRLGRMLFRLTARHEFAAIILSPGQPDEFDQILQISSSATLFRRNISEDWPQGSLIILNCTELTDKILSLTIQTESTLIIRGIQNKALLKAIVSKIKYGWILQGRQTLLWMARKKQPLHKAEIFLP